ncbi:hypothetical protein RBWH47_01523 [Rhodopirellula baltica WH47]|uniref:Uncharacterized protein n=1 Tax=Rhodopirellula baltica WH47 TaxID=991778 RepID=F2AKV9_RHOBT|nr:hypothetical protein RBWH47_01523 [Rhodopirellula baltica WH47]
MRYGVPIEPDEKMLDGSRPSRYSSGRSRGGLLKSAFRMGGRVDEGSSLEN